MKIWAMSKKDLVYYACEQFFGIQRMLKKPKCVGNGVRIIADASEQIISGHCLDDDSIPECWEEIAQQLYAMKEGWID